MSASGDFIGVSSGGTPGAQERIVLSFGDTAGLYAATRFSYSQEDRDEIIRCLEAALDSHLDPNEKAFFFFQLGSIGVWALNTVLQLPELEDERARNAERSKQVQAVLGVCADAQDDADLAAARPFLQAATNRLAERISNLDARIANISSRYPKTKKNNRWFAQILQARLAEAFEGQGGTVSEGKPFLAYHDAVVKPVLTNAAVYKATNCAWSEGMARTFAAKYRGGGGRRR